MRLLAFIGVVLLAGCATSTDPVGSRFIKKVQVRAVDGAVLTIAAAESARFAGTVVTIPPGALAADTNVTVEEGLDSLAVGGDQPLSVVLWLGPDGTALSSPAQVVLPIAAPDAADQPEDLQLLLERGGAFGRISVPAVTVDLTARHVSFETTILGRTQVVRHTCTSNGECAPSECVNGRCRGAACGSVKCALGARCCNAACEQCGAVGAPCGPAPQLCVPCVASSCVSPRVCVAGTCRDPAPVVCGTVTCAAGAVCCNPACGQCVASGQACPSSCPPQPCLPTVCNAGTPCCPPGQACVNRVCQPAAVPCGTAVCRNGQVCCNASCSTCVNPGETCSQVSCLCPDQACGPLPGSPSCTCPDGTLGCNTGRCVHSGANATCHWELRTCP